MNLAQLFEERARTSPEAVALYEGDRSVTLSELDARAERVAAGLRARGVRPGSSVGLHVERSIDGVAGLLGILRARSAVVPLPPSYPVGRLREILDFATLDAVIDHAESRLDPSLPVAAVRFSELASACGTGEAPGPGDPGQPAFILCSSGSTGRPKMIVRSHESFFHRLSWTWEQHPFGADEVGCQKAHMTTTHAVYELFEPLLGGVPTVIVPDHEVRDLERFWDIVRSRGVTRLLIVPSALRASLDMPGFAMPPLHVLVLMGEYVHPGLAERVVAACAPATHVYSIYGSTEASSTLVCDLRESLRPGEELPLGRPLTGDVRPLVLDGDLVPVEPGQAGRLYLAGRPLFTEYAGDPTLTASVMVRAPGHPEPLYDSHDRVRVLVDGSLEFLGRVDHTVKIRGFRIDLADVEGALLRHEGVQQAAVVVHEPDSGAATLVGFFVPADVDRAAVYQTLRETLPAYMVPSTLVGLDAFPLTSSAKVDRVRLRDGYGASSAAPSESRVLSDSERRVREAWERTLGHRSFELGDSFFEVGGDSLSVFTLVQGLRQAFGLDKSRLTVESAYRAPTVEGLAETIDALPAGHLPLTGESTPLLVTLRSGRAADQPPLFLISSAGGTLGAYEKLAKALGTQREIIGVRDPFVWGERDPTEGFHAWVRRFVDALRERQPHGPYFVCAYSSAGAFGYEIARRLRADGEPVALLALIDPRALDRGSRWRYGYWALRAAYMRPAFRELVRLAGWLRVPAVRLLGAFRQAGARGDRDPSDTPPDTPSEAQIRQITEYATRTRQHLRLFSALLELNTDLPFALSDDDFAGVTPDRYLSLLQKRVESLTPDVDPERVERIAVQYEMQVRAQHAYELGSYDGPVLLVEPETRYQGLLEAQLRPHVRRLTTRILELGPPSERTRVLTEQFGGLAAHYRSMRDDVFVEALARELDPLLDDLVDEVTLSPGREARVDGDR